MTAPETIIGVPTFRRPQWLSRCLRSLLEQKTDRPFAIVVADNDTERAEGIAVCEQLRSEGISVPLTAIRVADRGISHARNALVAEPLKHPSFTPTPIIHAHQW